MKVALQSSIAFEIIDITFFTLSLPFHDEPSIIRLPLVTGIDFAFTFLIDESLSIAEATVLFATSSL